MIGQPFPPPIPHALRSLPGVLGVGFGIKETGGQLTPGLAWRVYIGRKKVRNEIPASELIPLFIDGFATDVIEYNAPVACSSQKKAGYGQCIANSKGVPGTISCIAHSLTDQQPVLLSNYHVLFGNGAMENDKVWLVNDKAGKRAFTEAGKLQLGRIGTVRYEAHDIYVDCAISSFKPDSKEKINRDKFPEVKGIATAQAGDRVTKSGAATGHTSGIVVDAAYPDIAWIEGNSFAAHRQLLIRSNDEKPFSGEGDSGAMIFDQHQHALGLLWGTNSRGEGVACPIAPVLFALHITIEQPATNWLRRLTSFYKHVN
jgi:hypothetical protein